MRSIRSGSLLALLVAATVLSGRAVAQSPTESETAAPAFNDHQNMMEQLGITKLRPGKNPQEKNDEATANPYKDTMPDPLQLKDGTKVTSAEQWSKRRAEILEDFEREVYGRIPENVPKVTWAVTGTTEGTIGGIPTITKTLVGHVDNTACPEISVNIQASFTVPGTAKKLAPIVVEFGGFNF